MRLDPRDAVRFSALSSPDEILAGAANPYHAARPRRVSAAGLRPLQAKLSRNSNQIARGGIRQFESYMPNQRVRSLRVNKRMSDQAALSAQEGVRALATF
jgi:hypothetical protein